MTLTEMSLPIDIPWKRMSVSEDMIDQKAGDLNFPEKWNSSIAVFYHEPTEVPPEYCDRKITYLKIVCTITNYQINGDDVTILDALRMKFGEDYPLFAAYKDFDARLTQSFPCYGALLQVAVFPNPSEGVELHDFPYISAFQPRKREMYEVVTESGEIASQSGNKVNISKGGTSTETTEDYDLELGGGGHSGGWGLWSYTAGQQQVGTIERSSTQKQDITTTDASREKRESHSHTSNVSQLYSLLQGYHLGTNRAMFFMQPRPHIQDTKFTFVRGLRRLEGIQEFFLIVNRPASVPGFCVEIALETAHTYLKRAYFPRLIPYTDSFMPGNLEKTAYALGIDINDYKHHALLVATWNQFPPWVRHLAHVVAQQGPGYLQQSAQALKDANVTKSDWAYLQEVTGRLPDIDTEEIRLIFEEYESDSGQFFLTGRRLYSCVTPAAAEEEEKSIPDVEKSTKSHISTYDKAPSIVYWKSYLGIRGGSTKFPEMITHAMSLNSMVDNLNQTLWSSLCAANRIPYGKVSFLETDFILDEFKQFIRLLGKAGIKDRGLAETESILPFVEKGLGRVSGVQGILQLGTVTTNVLARDFNVTTAEARKFHLDLLVKALSALDEKTIDPKARFENPISERFAVEYPKDRLRDLERSSRLFEGEPIDPEARSGISRLIGRLSKFLFGQR